MLALLVLVLGIFASISPLAYEGTTTATTWTSTFDAGPNGAHDTIGVKNSNSGNSLSKVEYSTDGGVTWHEVSASLVTGKKKTKISVGAEEIPHNAKVKVTGTNENSSANTTPPGDIN